MRARLPVTLAALALLMTGQAFAHHSGAMFDRTKTVTVTGAVKRYLYTNPHSWVTVVAKSDDGAQITWDVEAFTPLAMQRWGIVPSTLKEGDLITLRLHPLRDGRRGGSLVDITLASGRYVHTTATANSTAPDAALPPR